MPRLPYQVLVIPWRWAGDHLEYCVFERKAGQAAPYHGAPIPEHQVQFVAGGAEGDEMPLQAAKRELSEETGITDAAVMQLTSVCSIPTYGFSERHKQGWGDEVFVIPEYSFGAEIVDSEIRLSDEHSDFSWVPYEEALRRLSWDGNKTALYELNARLGLVPRGNR